MCGVVGILRPVGGAAIGRDTLIAMRETMVHRGPDDAGLWIAPDGRCGLAHRRLSIIDLSREAGQPMTNEDETVAVVYNGEIYNHADIRRTLEALGKYRWKTDHSDTEVLLHAYEEWGLACIDRFYGMFAFAIFDARDRDRPVLHLVRDRVGVKPLYVTRTAAGEWLFASEIRALLAHPAVTPEIDRTALWHYLTFIVAPAPLTLYRGIFKLPAGHSVTIDHAGRAAARQYWDCRPSAAATLSEAELSEDEAAAGLTDRLRTAIARRMVSDVPFGVLLSGGVDSGMNVALMSELMDRPVTTFSIGYQGHDDLNEFEYARRVSRRYGTEHHETLIESRAVQEILPELIRAQDEPIADNVCIPLYFLAKLVRERGTTVVQVGEGADENFLGYWWCEHYRDRAEAVYEPARRAGRARWWRRLIARGRAGVAQVGGEDLEILRRAERGEELFWGGAVCWWGAMRDRLTPDRTPFGQALDCPIEGLLPDSHRALDSHAVVAHHLAGLTGTLAHPEILQKIPYMEMKLRLPEHLLMRVDKMTMAHSVEARVPFLDHDVVDFATRLPPGYKLRDGVGKYILKKTAEPFLDADIVHRPKQGFGAPIEQWMQEPKFGARCVAALERSRLLRDGLLDADYVLDLARSQVARGGGWSFHLWTLLNVVLWHEMRIEGADSTF